MFHVNPTTGKVGTCSAKVGKCPFGGLDSHYTTPEAAQAAFENSMAGQSLTTKNKRPAVDADLSQYAAVIDGSTNPEVYVHPQGKVVVYDGGTGVIRVYKDGKPAKTSGTLSDFRGGRGAWKQVQLDQNAGNASAAISQEALRRQKLISLGLPADSPLDPLKPNPFTESTRGSSANTSWFSKHSAMAIASINSRLNPHKPGIEKSDAQDYWGTFSDASKGPRKLLKGPVFEVWKDTSTGRFRLVTTGGDHITQLGTEGFFMHDQTQGRIGEKSVMIGAFEAEPGGAMYGEVPNQSSPVYTYK